jgi:hypothetical protein
VGDTARRNGQAISAVMLLFFALILEMGKEKQGKTRKKPKMLDIINNYTVNYI